MGNQVILWLWKRLIILCCHSGRVNDLAFSPDGAMLATASDDHTVKLWDVATGEELQKFTGYPSGVGAVLFSPNGAHLGIYFGDSIQIVDLTEIPAREIVKIDARGEGG